MRRSLIHFWRLNLSVVGAAAVATAVLTGALVVGDSMRGSLARLALERLGGVDFALAGGRLVGEGAAAALAVQPDFAAALGEEPAGEPAVAPVLALPAAAVHAGTRARASGVSVWGVDGRFAAVYGPGAEALDLVSRPGQVFPAALINAALARELGAAAGHDLVLSYPRPSEVPRDTVLASQDPADALDSVRLTVAGVLPDRGVGRFSLTPHQAAPRNVFVELATLQRATEAPGRVNTLLVGSSAGAEPRAGWRRGRRASAPGAVRRPQDLTDLLRRALTLDDLGLVLRPGPGWVAVESRELVLRPAVAAALERAAAAAGATATLPVLTYLANSMRVGGSEVPYSTVAALPAPVPPPFGSLTLVDGAPAPALADDEILLDAWVAEDLGAAPGDRLILTYYVVGRDDRLETAEAEFRVAGVAAMAGLATDAGLTPEVPGIADAERIAAWKPPFPIDLGRIRPRDEAYWDRYRAAPKAFVTLAAGRRLWASRYGDLTSIRLAPPTGTDPAELERVLGERLLAEVPLESFGLAFQPVKARGLAAATGATDFSGLFVGFSLFLIVAAALLVALLFSLAVESRAAEVGLRLAVGYPFNRVRRQLLAEGAVLAAAGALAGTGLAVAYAGLLLDALGRWWQPLVATPFLGLAVEPATLALGSGLSVVLVVAAIAATLRRLRRVPAVALLRGETAPAAAVVKVGRRRGWAWWTTLGGLGLAALLLAAALAIRGGETSPALFFGVGAALLTAGFAAFAGWCRRGRHRSEGWASLARGWRPLLVPAMAARNSARHPGRSLLSVVLVGCASFVLVSVGANRRGAETERHRERASGTGGYALVAESDLPIRQPLDRPEGLAELGFPEEAIAGLAGVQVVPLRLLPGEDASCLNLYQPTRPRVLGAPPEFVARGGFRFKRVADTAHLGSPLKRPVAGPAVGGAEAADPWTLLEAELEPGVIAAIGDENSVRWILHLRLGDELELTDDRGEPVRLRIVGLLDHSIFQSELLISEAAFVRHFPGHGGYRYFLIDLAETPPPDPESVTRALEAGLARYGFDATPTAERLARYGAVENMYLSTFQALGGLGLLLGTLGLGVVLVRSVLERRGELATLRAFGYRRARLAWLVVAESAFLLLVGLAAGAAAGLVAVAPHLVAGGAPLPWAGLAATLAAVLAAGLLSATVAVAATLRVPLLPALKAE